MNMTLCSSISFGLFWGTNGMIIDWGTFKYVHINPLKIFFSGLKGYYWMLNMQAGFMLSWSSIKKFGFIMR